MLVPDDPRAPRAFKLASVEDYEPLVGSESVDRLLKKFDTAKTLVPRPKAKPGPAVKNVATDRKLGALFFGTSASPSYEAVEMLAEEGIPIDTMRIRAFPFHGSLDDFVHAHDLVFVIEQNRDGQMRRLIMNECEIPPGRLKPVLNYSGTPITARKIADEIRATLAPGDVKVVPLHPEIA